MMSGATDFFSPETLAQAAASSNNTLRASAATFVPRVGRSGDDYNKRARTGCAVPTAGGGTGSVLNAGAPSFVPTSHVCVCGGTQSSTSQSSGVRSGALQSSGIQNRNSGMCVGHRLELACPDGHGALADGTPAAHPVGPTRGRQRYGYVCHTCGKCFDQKRPDRLRPDEERGARWQPDLQCSGSLYRATVQASSSTQHNDKRRTRAGRCHKPRDWQLRAGQHHGEVRVGFHNSSGQNSDAIARKRWVERLLDRFDIVGTCELNADALVRAEMERAASARQGGYRVWFAPGTAPKTGMALLVSNRLASMRVDVGYRDPSGHTLIVTLNVLGRLPLLLVITHAPPTTDAARAAYFTDLLTHIPARDPRQPDRQGMWMGDFNFVEPRTDAVGMAADASGSAARSARATMLAAYARVCEKLGSAAAGGLEDAYAITHDGESAPTSKAGRAIDRVLIDPRMVGGVPGIVDADTVHQTDLQVTGKRKLRAPPDHKATRVSLRLTDITRPTPRPRYTMDGLTDVRRAEVEKAVTIAIGDARATPQAAEDAYIAAVKRLLDGYAKADRKARCSERHTLISKLDALEARARGERRGTPARAALEAQAGRVRVQLQIVLQQREDAQARQREQQRWQRELGDTRALFDSIRPDKAINLPLDTLRIPTHVDASGKQQYDTLRGQEEVARGFTAQMDSLFNEKWRQVKSAMKAMIEPMERDTTCHLSPAQAETLQPEYMFSPERIDAAMDAIRKGTMPGESGVSVDLVCTKSWRALMKKHVSELAISCFAAGTLTARMREAIISVLYKGKGERDLCKSHRPVSLTDATLRIIDKAMQMALNKVLPSILCGINKAFLPGEHIENDTLSMAEAARWCHANGGGAIACLDAEKAYDRVHIQFLRQVLQAMRFPPQFIEFVDILYADNWARLKINGHIGAAFRQGNGLRQGLPSSCPFWLLYVEPLVRHLRDDPERRGITIPGELGHGTAQLKVAAYADDIKPYCANTKEVRHLAVTTVPLWYKASGQIMSVEKFVVILLGTSIHEARPNINIREWQRYGLDEADKSLGIRVDTPVRIADQWYAKQREVEQLAVDVTAGRRLAGSIYARSTLAKGGFASKVFYTFKIQAPYEGARRIVFDALQKTMNRLVFGGFCNITIDTAQQPPCDGGVGHLHVERRMHAEWAHLAGQLTNHEPAAWKNVWWRNLRDVYGELCDRDLLLSTCSYQLLKLRAAPSQVQQCAMMAWGALKKAPVLLEVPPMTTRRQNAIELAAYDGVPPPQPQPQWRAGIRNLDGAGVGEQRLWFNTALHGHHPTRMHKISTMLTELEAVQWAQEGLVRVHDAMNGARVISRAAFHARYASLDAGLILEVHDSMPPEWPAALRDGTAVPTDERCLPAGLLDEKGSHQQYAITHAPTLVQRAVAPMNKLKQRHIHTAMTATAFHMPRTFDPHAGGAARHAHLFGHEDADGPRTAAVARAVKCIRHPAVPSEMTEVAHKVAFSGFAFGPNKRRICKRDTCPCGNGHAETVEHTFKDCPRSKRLWELVMASWRAVTGETKVCATDGRAALLGDRSGTWLTEADEAEWAGLEEPWAVAHKATLHVLFTERNRDAAPHAPTRRTAAQLFQKVQSTVQLVASLRWHRAVKGRHQDGGLGMDRFRKRWEAPGIAVIEDGTLWLTVVLFMRDSVRDRWRRRTSSARDFRNQQFAPPDPPPMGMVHIYVEGSADTRKKNAPPPPGGYGCVAVDAGRCIFQMAGQITMATPHVSTITSNLATLIAFTRALEWAEHHHLARGRSICIRYNSEYAARICTGAWKARKHKEAAAVARNAWARLKKARSGQVWTQYTKRDGTAHAIACEFASQGKRGARIYTQGMNVD